MQKRQRYKGGKLHNSICIICVAICAHVYANDFKKHFTYPKKSSSLSILIEDLSDEQTDKAILGRSLFVIPWVQAPSSTTARDGLGPIFNANTCFSCHVNNGPGTLYSKSGHISRSSIIKVFIPNTSDNTKAKKINFADISYGNQIGINGIFGVPYEAKPNISTHNVNFVSPNGEKTLLQKLHISLKDLQYGALHKDAILSLRKAPALVGLGLIEDISDEDILANEDKYDKDNDGISGKANIVYSPLKKKYALGRFTYKASAPSVIEQVAIAAFNDMGLTNPLFENEGCALRQKKCKSAYKSDELDLPMERLQAIAFYLKSLKVPKQRVKDKPYKEGEQIFKNLNCAKCHIDNFTTKKGIKIAPYSDFLLHDLGEGLSDNVQDFGASGKEWRTTPLWGIGSYKAALGKNKVRYLHDGRARSINEAILWHGGEANNSKERYISLSKEKREKLLYFINQL